GDRRRDPGRVRHRAARAGADRRAPVSGGRAHAGRGPRGRAADRVLRARRGHHRRRRALRARPPAAHRRRGRGRAAAAARHRRPAQPHQEPRARAARAASRELGGVRPRMRAVVLATLLTTLLAARSAAASSASPPRDVAAVPMPASAAAATSALAAVRHEREQVWSALDPHLDGFYLDEDRAAVDLLDRYWSLTGEWVARYLDAHPRATTAELETALRELDRDVEARVLPVAGGFLVGTSQGEV